MKLFVEENESLNGRAGGRVWPLVPVPQIVYGAYDNADGTGIIALMDLNESGRRDCLDVTKTPIVCVLYKQGSSH